MSEDISLDLCCTQCGVEVLVHGTRPSTQLVQAMRCPLCGARLVEYKRDAVREGKEG